MSKSLHSPHPLDLPSQSYRRRLITSYLRYCDGEVPDEDKVDKRADDGQVRGGLGRRWRRRSGSVASREGDSEEVGEHLVRLGVTLEEDGSIHDAYWSELC
jgi:hypothetical protein